MERLAEVAREGLRTDIPAFEPGDTVKVMVRVREGDKERLQAFEGIVIAKRGGGISENFTVRKVSAGVGVERVFPIHSPTVASLELVRRGRVRRAERQGRAHPGEARGLSRCPSAPRSSGNGRPGPTRRSWWASTKRAAGHWL